MMRSSRMLEVEGAARYDSDRVEWQGARQNQGRMLQAVGTLE